MKRIQNKLTLIAMLLVFICSTAVAQEEEAHEIRIKIQKEIEGKMKQIDTILRLHEDSLREELHRKMEVVQRKHMREVLEKMERLRPKMERHRKMIILSPDGETLEVKEVEE